jgi:transcription elongation factor GreA
MGIVPMSLTVGQAISAYIAGIGLADRETASRELNRFGRWVGQEMPVAQLTTEQVFRYTETFAASKADANQRLAQVKTFLAYLHRQQATPTNLSTAIRFRRPPVHRPARRARDKPPEPILMTEQGHERLSAELKDLDERVRPEVTEQLRSAAADKDFSENAPYSAAKHKLSEVRTRINRIRRTLSAASVQVGSSTEAVELGTIVTLHSLIEDEEVEYQIVGAGEPLGNGRVSLRSPVGSAVLGKAVGDTIEVLTPMGAQRYRVEKIERR